MIFTEQLLKADINISTLGDNTIIVAPGDGKYLAIDFITFIPSASVTVQLKDGTTNFGGPLPLLASQAGTFENATRQERGVITCSNNAAFVINLSAPVQTGGWVRYRIIGGS